MGAEQVEVGEAEQLFPDAIAVAQAEVTHAADLVRRFAVLDPAFRNSRMPGRQSVESRTRAQTRSERPLMTLDT